MNEARWWQSLRDEFPILQRHTFVWWGGQSPLARTVRDRMTQAIVNWDIDPLSIERNEWNSFDGARSAAALLSGCDVRRVILCESTSNAMSLAATMILSQMASREAESANVVIHWEANPASSYPWLSAQRRGLPIEIRWPKPIEGETPADSLLGAVDDHTIALVITDVSYLTGELLSLAAIFEARRRAHWALVIDAAQSAGAIPLRDHTAFADFVGYPAYKWLFGPPGVGFLLVSDEWLDRTVPPIVGWAATKQPAEGNATVYDPLDGGAAFRYGMPNLIPIAGAEEGLKLAIAPGIDRVADRIRLLTSRMLDGLERLGYPSPTPSDPARRAGIVAVDVRDADRVTAELVRNSIITVPEKGRLRLDLHAINTEEDVERIIDCLSRLPSDLRLASPIT